MTPAAVLFDLDGTLTDPAVGITTAFRLALEACGVDPAGAGPLERFIGPPLHEAFASLGLAPAGVAEAITTYRAYYGEVGLFENTPYPGIAAALGELVGAGCRLAVATSKPWAFAERILARFELDGHFEVVAGAELDGRNRHKAEVIAVALRGLGLEAGPGEPGAAGVAMVGDRAHDVFGAASHGLEAVGVAWGYGSRRELEEAGAARIVDRPADLVSALLG